MRESIADRFARRAYRIDPSEIWTPGDSIQMHAIVGACAMIAQADGWVTADERRRMIDRVRRSPSVALFGIDEVMNAFEALNRRFEKDPDDGEAAAEASVVRLRGQSGPSHMLIETACSIAEADGGFDAEERQAILRLCGLLDIDPASHDLIIGGPAR